MSKKIYTIQSPDKKMFDEQVNELLKHGCELVDGSYEVIEKEEGVIYSQVVSYYKDKTVLKLHDNGQLHQCVSLKSFNENDEPNGILTLWYDNGIKEFELNYKDRKKEGKSSHWYRNGQKHIDQMYKNDLPNGVQIDYNKNGEKFMEVILEDGKVIEYIYPKKKRNT